MSQNRSTAVMQRRHVTVDKLDYYPTPPWATRAFLREVLGHYLPLPSVWEPACGEGHMVEVLREFTDNCTASDVHDYGRCFTVGSYVGEGIDVIEAPRTGNTFHPTEKPVQLMAAIVEWTHGTVLDPFMGSGSTGVACARLGRKFIGIEIDESHFNTACDRIRKANAAPDFFSVSPSIKATQEAML